MGYDKVGDDLDIKEVEKYVNVVIPNIEKELGKKELGYAEKLELYNLYVSVLRMVAPFNFISYNKYLELDEDHNNPTKAFYHHRRSNLEEMFNAFNDMEMYDKYDILLVSLPPRVGKEQPLYSKILTPTGWKTMGEMKIGKKIVGSNGKQYSVTGVFPQGIKPVYTVTFDDGSKVECGLEHLWKVQTRDDRKRNKDRIVTTKEMMKNLYVENKTRKNYSINYISPSEFTNKLKEDDLHPYVLGCLLGDGGLSSKSSVGFTNTDVDIINRLSSLLPETDILKRTSYDDIQYMIVKKNKKLKNKKGYSLAQTTLTKLREYGLHGEKSEGKFIPTKYLYSSVENRLELLKGLMDTDGFVNNENNSYMEYSTVSEKLSNDVQELIKSLGGRCTLGTKIGSYVKNNKRIMCKKVYRISFNLELNPFYCARKHKLFQPRIVRNVKYISSIELSGTSECQCIMVNSPDHLYITDGYNLTHNTTTGIRFLSWIIGKYPEYTELATSYSDNITTSFYIGVMEIVQSPRFKEIFTDAPLITQNAKREEIWLKVAKRYPSIMFVPIDGSMTGRAEAGKYLYCDDLVSGIEQALSVTRLEKLWQTYTVNCKQRKKDGCKEIHVATQWSVHDVITKLSRENENNPRCKFINMDCFDENHESNFNFTGGFSTEYYLELERTMDKLSFDALYRGKPVEREGLLYHKDELKYYFSLPKGKPDSIVAVCDSKNMGKDFVSSPIAYVYGNDVYIDDVVYNNGLPEITRPLVANKWLEHKVVRADVEMNNGGNYYAEDLDKLIKDKNGKTSVRLFFSANNKNVKIITYADFVKKNFIFREESTYDRNSEYARFMNDVLNWTQLGNNKHDDAPDSLAMLAQLIQDLTGNQIKILDRRSLRL